jgi:hypothetical protein
VVRCRRLIAPTCTIRDYDHRALFGIFYCYVIVSLLLNGRYTWETWVLGDRQGKLRILCFTSHEARRVSSYDARGNQYLSPPNKIYWIRASEFFDVKAISTSPQQTDLGARWRVIGHVLSRVVFVFRPTGVRHFRLQTHSALLYEGYSAASLCRHYRGTTYDDGFSILSSEMGT